MFFFIISSDIFVDILTTVGACSSCGSTFWINSDIKNKRGLAQHFTLSCQGCDWKKPFYTSNELDNQSRGRKRLDINTRTVMAFRELGRGHSSLKKFCGIMSMRPPMNKKAYDDIISKLHPAYLTTAQDNMAKAEEELRKSSLDPEYTKEKTADVDISSDGTWQKRGYASLNGVVTTIAQDNGNCVDFDVW